MHGLRITSPAKGNRMERNPALQNVQQAKTTAAHRIYYAAHKQEIDAAHTYAKQSSLSKAKGRDRCAEQWFRNQETLNRLLKRMIDSFGDWEEHYSLVGGEQLSNPTFIVVSKSGAKRKEVLTEPLPSWA